MCLRRVPDLRGNGACMHACAHPCNTGVRVARCWFGQGRDGATIADLRACCAHIRASHLRRPCTTMHMHACNIAPMCSVIWRIMCMHTSSWCCAYAHACMHAVALRGGVGRGQGHASALSRERPTELEGHAGDPAERRGRGMGEHAGRGACGASMQGGLSRTTWPLTRVHLEVSGPAPGQWNTRTPAALTRVAFVGLSPGGRPTASPLGRDQREQDGGCG